MSEWTATVHHLWMDSMFVNVISIERYLLLGRSHLFLVDFVHECISKSAIGSPLSLCVVHWSKAVMIIIKLKDGISSVKSIFGTVKVVSWPCRIRKFVGCSHVEVFLAHDHWVFSWTAIAIVFHLSHCFKSFLLSTMFFQCFYCWNRAFHASELFTNFRIIIINFIDGLSACTNVQTYRPTCSELCLLSHLWLFLLHDAQQPIEHLLISNYNFLFLAPLNSYMIAEVVSDLGIIHVLSCVDIWLHVDKVSHQSLLLLMPQVLNSISSFNVACFFPKQCWFALFLRRHIPNIVFYIFNNLANRQINNK